MIGLSAFGAGKEAGGFGFRMLMVLLKGAAFLAFIGLRDAQSTAPSGVFQ